MIKIDKNIPIPNVRKGSQGRNSLYPWKEMNVGDSFLFCKQKDIKKKYNNAYQGLSRAGRVYKKKFTARKTNDGLRIWRIK